MPFLNGLRYKYRRDLHGYKVYTYPVWAQAFNHVLSSFGSRDHEVSAG